MGERRHYEQTDEAMRFARNIVNQILDEAGTGITTRQRINDDCDQFVAFMLDEYLESQTDDEVFQETSALPAHLKVNEAEGLADCSVCKLGVTAPLSFGGIPRSDMLAAFIVQHAVHTKAGKPSGLTAAGKATKAAQAALSGGDA